MKLTIPAALLLAALSVTAQDALLQDALAQDTQAQEPAAEDPVVARVNGADLLRSEVEETAKQLPPQYQQQLDAIFPMLVQRAIDLRLLGGAAEAAEMKDDPEVQRRMADIRLDIMREVYLEQQVAERISDDMVQERYDAYVEANPPKPQVHARHILVEEEAKARELIVELDGGADFAELAKEHSKGPSGAQGGELSYFSKEQMVPAFAEAAFSLDKGSHSKDPVQTEFGWHVIEILDRRELPPPALDEVRDQLFDELSQEAVQQILDGLRNEAKIEILEAPAAQQ